MKTILKIAIVVFVIFFTGISYLMYIQIADKTKISPLEHEIQDLVNAVNYKSEWDVSEQYRITPSLAKAKIVLDANDITLVTQCSYQNKNIKNVLFNLVNIWQGPLSISIFSQATEVSRVINLIGKLRHCHHNIAVYVTFHLVTFEGSGNVKYISPEPFDCFSVEENPNYAINYDLSVPYPVNLMRNVARRGVFSNFFLLIDVDLIPSPGLRQNFIDLIRTTKLDNKTVYVVPAFEAVKGIQVPLKEDVKGLVEEGLLRPFYAELCLKCHSCVDYSTWLSLPPRSGLSIAYYTPWIDPCEPFYISQRDVPLYDETFKQYGFNRISQMCELHVAGYTFSVLDNAYLVHWGLKTSHDFHQNKEKEQELNREKFRQFKLNLKYKYPTSSRSC